MRSLPADMKLRVLLAQALFGEPEALLLDEPTNHMDLESIHWLEGFLQEYKGVLVVICTTGTSSTPSARTSRTSTTRPSSVYPGDYDDMVRQKVQCAPQIESEQPREAEEDRPAPGVRRPLRRRHARQPGAERRKEIVSLKPEDLKRSNIRAPTSASSSRSRRASDVVATEGLTQGFDGEPVFQDLTLNIKRARDGDHRAERRGQDHAARR